MTREQTTSARIRFQIVVRAAFIMFAEACGVGFGYADERVLPFPLVTIYPGDIIRESMLGEKTFSGHAATDGLLIDSKGALLGKVARRTLLPDRPIPAIAVDSPKVVAINAQVKIVFEEGAMVITTYGSALQAGAVGDLIRVRNQDSGLVISGKVQADGSILVSGG